MFAKNKLIITLLFISSMIISLTACTPPMENDTPPHIHAQEQDSLEYTAYRGEPYSDSDLVYRGEEYEIQTLPYYPEEKSQDIELF